MYVCMYALLKYDTTYEQSVISVCMYACIYV